MRFNIPTIVVEVVLVVLCSSWTTIATSATKDRTISTIPRRSLPNLAPTKVHPSARIFPRGGQQQQQQQQQEHAENRHESSSSSPSVSVSPHETLPAGIAEDRIDPMTMSNDDDDHNPNDGLTVPSPSPPSLFAKRLANLRERTIPALLMLAGVGGIAKYGKEDGLILLTWMLQGRMYHEMTRVIGGDFPHPFYRWWWFGTASVAFNLPRILTWATTEIATGVTLLVLSGIVSVIVRFNWNGTSVEEFRDWFRQAAVSFLAVLMVMLPSSYWIATLENFGMKWVALPAALVIINDTMAYLFGITLGRHKLLPVISPGKTWEGFVGAAVSTMVAAYFLLERKEDAIVLSVAASFVGPFGGFLASMIKRAYAQKDFGSFLPGHGGLVDRLDCQLILAPIVYLYLSLMQDRWSH